MNLPASHFIISMMLGCSSSLYALEPKTEHSACQVQTVQLEGVEIQPTAGSYSKNAVHQWSSIETASAKFKTINRKPKILITSSKNANYYLVQMIQDDIFRFIYLNDLENGMAWPSEDYPEIKCDLQKRADGTVEVEPASPLKIGEYAIWAPNGPGELNRSDFPSKEAYKAAVIHAAAGVFWPFRVESSAKKLACKVFSVRVGDTEITPTAGTYKENRMNQWSQLVTPHAAHRITNTKPKITLKKADYAKYNLVKLTEDGTLRYLYLINQKNGLACPSELEADIEYNLKQLVDGSLELVPKKALPAGEYALWALAGPGELNRADYLSEEEFKDALSQCAAGIFWDFAVTAPELPTAAAQ